MFKGLTFHVFFSPKTLNSLSFHDAFADLTGVEIQVSDVDLFNYPQISFKEPISLNFSICLRLELVCFLKQLVMCWEIVKK